MRTRLSVLVTVASLGLGACAQDASKPTPGASPDMGAPATQPPSGPPTAPPTAPPSTPTCADNDRDGYQDARCNANAASTPRGGDCDDSSNLVSPARAENCADQIDNNCNGQVNEGCAAACVDLDQDGFQDAKCNADPRTGADCDDADRTVNPGASEICGNFKDDDCYGGDLPCLQNCTDNDHDGYGEGSGCFGPDCDDTNARRNPGTAEVCGDNIDQDCSENVANSPELHGDLPCPRNCRDADHDGFGVGADCYGADCNDGDSNQNAGAREVPEDGIDQDCNGSDLTLAADCQDRDRDGYGTGPGCAGPDCDDGDPRINPGRDEVCGNGKDDDCQGGDRGCSPGGDGNCTDTDGDGYGPGCAKGTVDCDLNNAAINPDAPETCNGVDDNCNGQVDECPRRGQTCGADGTCVSGPGAPCQNDNECDITANLHCNTEVDECRILDGQACSDSAYCNPGAECTTVDACGPADACYQAKGGPCAADCDCTGIYLCHDSGVCVECLDDAQCHTDQGEICTAGGYCAPAQDISFDLDQRIAVVRVILDCWTLYAESVESHACAALTLPDPIMVGDTARNQIGPASDGDVTDFVCSSDALTAAGFTQDDIDVATEVFGCGLFDLENIWWRSALTAGTTGEWCVYYAPAKPGFGIPDDVRAAVVVDRCNLSVLD